jgi:hypothetical protein
MATRSTGSAFGQGEQGEKKQGDKQQSEGESKSELAFHGLLKGFIIAVGAAGRGFGGLHQQDGVLPKTAR